MTEIELQDAPLSAMDLDAIAEMNGENAPPAKQPETPLPPGQTPAWRPRGQWGYAGLGPAEVGIDGSDKITLLLRLESAAPSRPQLNATRDELAERARAAMLAGLQKDPAYESWREAAAEFELALRRVTELEKQAHDLETERLKLTAKPKGSGPRLVTIRQQQEELAKFLEAARAEADCLKPIATSARQAVEAIIRQLAQDTARQSSEDHLAILDDRLAAFAAANSEMLTALAAMLQARKAAVQASELVAFAMNQLRNPEPNGKA